ncbi:MAG TPA: N-acetylmuramoyl-L-alanine amidase [Bryobacteraceae bacterium]|nr:N-acetylmuramoyl-L-alanine amidase [Bryobacteraceae bacterium]
MLALAGFALPQAPAQNTVTAVRHWTLNDVTRVVVETTADFTFAKDRVPNPDRLFFDLSGMGVRVAGRRVANVRVNDPRLKQIRVAETQPGVARVVFDLAEGVDFSASQLSNPPRLIVELRSSQTAAAPVPGISSAARPMELPAEREPVREPLLVSPGPALPRASEKAVISRAPVIPPSARKRTPLPPPPTPAKLDGSQSMTRVLGLKVGRIVIDAGHGGHDTGTIGPAGVLEKELVLDVARRLGALVESKLNAEVVYTRSDDTFIALEGRTALANESRADLFLSIHANSSPSPSSSGVETYYLNFTSDRAALEVAARENASAQSTVYELKTLLQKIALQDKVEESREFAHLVQQALYNASLRNNPRTRDRGVKKAPFVVLIGASMPSVLAEIGFVTNPRDEALFLKPEFRQKIAEGLYSGLSRYAATLSQFQVAQK